ncbi:MarR family transcriptional regulator [Mesorhizobium sp. CAU 1732]|uniref:MarR family winged helix-turn-helix transcriptional regulator n=1 Tax=Mesorhizobium sp. CAU 1732 TaxID=3140358 RepID=UPI003261AFA1
MPERVMLRPRTMYLMNQANQAVRTQLEQELRGLGLTGIQYTVLSIVDAREGISSAQLSRRFFVTPQTMNEIVSALERRGLLLRRESLESKRILSATLTDAGRDALGRCDAVADRVEGKFMSLLSDEDFAALRAILPRFLKAIREDGER